MTEITLVLPAWAVLVFCGLILVYMLLDTLKRRLQKDIEILRLGERIQDGMDKRQVESDE